MKSFAVSFCVLAASLLVLSAAKAPAEDVLASHLDTSVNPAVDFFDYANGGWLKKNPIPPSESGWGIGNVVQDEIYDRLRKISEDSAKSGAPAGSEAQKIGDFWSTAMDEPLAEKNGLSRLQPELDRIAAAKDLNGLLDAAFAEIPLRSGEFFSLFIGQDPKNSELIAVQLDQGGLGLPNRDSYFNTDENSVRVRGEYVKHLQRLLDLISPARPRRGAGEAVMRFETALAKASRKLADLRDPEKNYNKMATADVTAKLTPSIAWGSRLAAYGLPDVPTIIVGQPEFFAALELELKAAPLEDVKDYLRYHVVSAYAGTLSKKFDDEDFAFYGMVLSGQKEQRPRWKRALDDEERALGMVLGKLFVSEYFSQASKKRYSDLVEAIRDAYRERIEKLTWMSDATRKRALEKLARVGKKVGYPDKWKDYSELTIGRASFTENMKSAARWRFNDQVKKFGKPVDRTEWNMTPQTYNAYYNPYNNEIVLPAAIFAIPGLPDSDADDALIYGYAAAGTIGHEITHGFDDEGRQFDANGNLKSWWTKEDEEKFNARALVMVKQFDAYEPLPGVHINGKAALGENIADFGGVVIGLDAFKKTEQYKKGEKIAGLTPLQRYFLGYALGWLHQIRRENLARHLLSDVHSPSKWRVLGPLSNSPEFYDAFGIKPGDPMWRPESERVKIW